MNIQGPDNTPKPTEIHILSKLDDSKREGISIDSVIEDLKITKEESIMLGLKREYDLTKDEDIEAFNKDMKFEENGISIHQLIEDAKKRKAEKEYVSERFHFGLEDVVSKIHEGKTDKQKPQIKFPRISYSELLKLLYSQSQQMAANMLRDGGSTSCTVHTPEGDIRISINRSLGDRKHNEYITVTYPDGVTETVSPDGTVVNPNEESSEPWSDRFNVNPKNDYDALN